MEAIFKRLASNLIANQVKSDDFVDRLHYFVMSSFLFVMAAGSLLQKHFQEPINCFPPKGLGQDSYKENINEYCWTSDMRPPVYQDDTSSVLNSSTTPEASHPDSPFLIDFGTAFFRWVAFVFIGMGVTFKIPNILWIMLSSKYTSDLNKIRNLVDEARMVENERHKRIRMEQTVTYFETWVTGYKNYHYRCLGGCTNCMLPWLFCLGRSSGSYLSSLYIFVKILNLCNVCFNFAILSAVFDPNFYKYGIRVIEGVLLKGDWGDPSHFPRILLCDFVVEGGTANEAGEVVPTVYVVQCEMAVNVLLEKVFVILWFGLVLLAGLTAFNLILWLIRVKQPFSIFFFSKDYIEVVEAMPETDDGTTSLGTAIDENVVQDKAAHTGFVRDYLRSDGVLILRLLELNADRSIVVDLVTYLWARYKRVQKFRASMLSLNDPELALPLETDRDENDNVGKLNPALGLDNLGFVGENFGKSFMDPASFLPDRRNGEPSVGSPGLFKKKGDDFGLGALTGGLGNSLPGVGGLGGLISGDQSQQPAQAQQGQKQNVGSAKSSSGLPGLGAFGAGAGFGALGGLAAGGVGFGGLGGLAGGVGDKLGGLAGGVGDKLGGLTGGIGDKLGGITDLAGGASEKLGNLGGLVGNAGEKLGGIGGLGGLGDAASGVAGNIGGIGALAGSVGGLGAAASGAASKASEAVATATKSGKKMAPAPPAPTSAPAPAPTSGESGSGVTEVAAEEESAVEPEPIDEEEPPEE